MRKNKHLRQSIAIFLAVLCLAPTNVLAQSSSSNYRVEETYFGSGGQVDASSNNYRARQSTGSLGVGTSSSNNYDTIAGDNTPSAPFLEMAIMGPDVDFGVLSPDTHAYASPQGGDCNCTFYVRSYLSSDYSVISASEPPTSENGDTIEAKTTQGTPVNNNSIEEFGINLVANTSPGTFGAIPANIPDGSFADGQAAAGYQYTNQFKYVPNDTIATSPATAGNPGIGRTNYTISYIMKIANMTEAGTYKMQHNLIVIPTF